MHNWVSYPVLVEKANIILELCYGHKTVLSRASKLAFYDLELFKAKVTIIIIIIIIIIINYNNNHYYYYYYCFKKPLFEYWV